jgi:ABC-type enterochelin transport system substrate-binding protein
MEFPKKKEKKEKIMKNITTVQVYTIAADELLRRANVEDAAGRTATRDKLMIQYLEVYNVIQAMERPESIEIAD